MQPPAPVVEQRQEETSSVQQPEAGEAISATAASHGGTQSHEETTSGVNRPGLSCVEDPTAGEEAAHEGSSQQCDEQNIAKVCSPGSRERNAVFIDASTSAIPSYSQHSSVEAGKRDAGAPSDLGVNRQLVYFKMSRLMRSSEACGQL